MTLQIIKRLLAVLFVKVDTIAGCILKKRTVSVGKKLIQIKVIITLLFTDLKQNGVDLVYVGVVYVITESDRKSVV